MIEASSGPGDAKKYVQSELDKGERLMGFGHRVYRAEDPRARVLRRTAKELDAPRYEVAAALEQAALEELHARKPDRVLATNVEYWAAVVLDFAEVPAHMFTSMFTCARTAGWAAHILEQKRTGRLVRPSANYIGPTSRPLQRRARRLRGRRHHLTPSDFTRTAAGLPAGRRISRPGQPFSGASPAGPCRADPSHRRSAFGRLVGVQRAAADDGLGIALPAPRPPA